jgi:hypothetical protein
MTSKEEYTLAGQVASRFESSSMAHFQGMPTLRPNAETPHNRNSGSRRQNISKPGISAKRAVQRHFARRQQTLSSNKRDGCPQPLAEGLSCTDSANTGFLRSIRADNDRSDV